MFAILFEKKGMKTVHALVSFLRLPGMLLTLVSTVLLILTLLNWMLGFSDAIWLKTWFGLLYLFFMIFGVLNYILVIYPQIKSEKSDNSH